MYMMTRMMMTYMQSLASSGVRLSQSYVTPKCSPSRAALMTGLYPWRLGLQRGAIGKPSTQKI